MVPLILFIFVVQTNKNIITLIGFLMNFYQFQNQYNY